MLFPSQQYIIWQQWSVGWKLSRFILSNEYYLGTPFTIRQKLLEAVSPKHGRILIYVWAIEQDEHSKRVIPVTHTDGSEEYPCGQDVFVPWVLSAIGNARTKVQRTEQTQNVTEDRPDVIQRYYHMFAKDELRELVQLAVQEMGLEVDSPFLDGADTVEATEGVEVVKNGWERSNHYIELQRWQR